MPRLARSRTDRRPGKIVVMFVLLLTPLIGMLGMVIDVGLLTAAHRQASNAADAAAMAAAWDLLRSRGVGTARATATTYVQQYNGLAGATVALNSPPAQGPYTGDSRYAEVIVTYPVATLLAHVVGVNRNQQVRARAVAGYEAVAAGEGVALLDPAARPGIAVSGGGTLRVNGRVVVNSQGAGYDENNNWINLGQQQYAATTGNNSTVKASLIEVVGEVDVPANYQPLATGDPSPLRGGSLPEVDPLRELPTPRTGLAGVDSTVRGSVNLTGGTTTLQPGVSTSIRVANNASVTFAPGIYILKPANNTQNALTNTGTGVVTGDGVMFYNTGSNFNVGTGGPESSDGDTLGSTSAQFADVTINGANVTLNGLKNAASPFDGMLFYQRRWNTKGVDVQGNGSGTILIGTLYGQWANFKVSCQGTYNAQFIAGSLAVSGGANITINYAGTKQGKAPLVFLVE